MTGRMVDAAPARARVTELVAEGMRQTAIAEAANMSPAAVNILLHGHYTPSRPPQQTINVEVEARLMAVQLQASGPKRSAAEQRCAPSAQFELAGYRVGRCAGCGELAPLRTGSARDGYQILLVAHPTLAADAGDDK